MPRILPGTFAVALLLAGCGAFGHAPPKPLARPAAAPWHPPTTMLLPYAAPDGSLTRAQLEAGLRRDFDKLDVKHDGCLDDDQVRAINEARWKQDESTASPLIDFKQNGCVDFDEFAATARTLFEQLDRNGDGRLTAQELHPGTAPKNGQQSPAADSPHGHRHGGDETGN